jgi:hypothetical protein
VVLEYTAVPRTIGEAIFPGKTPFVAMLTLMLITNDPATARTAVRAGVDRIFVDLERFGKEKRQQGRSTVISRHCLQDVSALRKALPSVEILVRTNPIHEGLKNELDEVIARGADVVMLPMFKHPDDVLKFVDYVSGRARVSLLLETPQAMVRLPLLLNMKNIIHEVYIGLNDLHIGLGLKFMFECVAGGLVEFLAKQVQLAGLKFGFGGIGRLGTGTVPAELVLSEHVRLGSSMVILSRTFHEGFEGSFAEEIKKLRTEEQWLMKLPKEAILLNWEKFNRLVWQAAGCV